MNGSKASSGRAAWRLVGCLIKAPLGCLAFFIGAAVVLVLFLPPALGGLVSDGLEEWFARRYRGTLEVKEAWLGSLYGPQKVESITLRDPERNEILHATLRAPSLGPVFWEGAEDWGPIEIHVDNVRLVRDADGVSNLALALTRQPLTEGDEDSAHELDIPRELQMGLRTVAFVVEIDRFSWADTAGHEVRLTDVVCDGLLNLRAPSMQMDVEGVATLTDGVVDAVAFELTLPELLRWSEPAATPPWSFELSAGPVPVAAAEILVGVFDRLDRALGPTVACSSDSRIAVMGTYKPGAGAVAASKTGTSWPGRKRQSLRAIVTRCPSTKSSGTSMAMSMPSCSSPISESVRKRKSP